ncbi:MAG: NADH-quinone oxidoreductase subunit M [Candidatus Eisenbacteria bacterium]|nr:NADH-quinone oxidoreductase subunit M [Candidatus Eisenbacteria bacterium]
MGILSLLVFLPTAGALALLAWPRRNEEGIKWFAMLVSVADLLVSVRVLQLFRTGEARMQLEERLPWLGKLGASYHLGVDGITLFLLLLTTLLTSLAILSSWTSVHKKIKEYMISLLMLETGMLGVFVSLDLVLFYLFWEAMLIPMYLLIGVWGGERRIYAAVKFFLYTMAGSVLMLVAILVLYFHHHAQTGTYTTDLLALYGTRFGASMEAWLFLAFFVAFAIKVPMFPFHTWLPDAHVEAPTAGSVILAGVLLKMGTYGMLRFAMPLFPHATLQFMPMVLVLSVIGIIYGAMVAMVQPDLKKLVAYSSVSHLGFCVLGMFALNTQGLQGSLMQMLNHGVSTGALFLLVGMIYERRHTRMISEFGGLWKAQPIYSAMFMVVMLSSVGLPGTNGFVGEFLVLVGAFEKHRWITVFASTGVILSAVYMLWMFQRAIFGKLENPKNQELKDINTREKWVLIPLLVLIFWMGIYPKPVLSRMEPSVNLLLRDFQGRASEVTMARPPAAEVTR